MRRLLILLVLFIIFGIGSLLWLRTRDASSPAVAALESTSATAAPAVAPIIDKQSPVISIRRFDPADPSPDMPPLHAGEQAQCDSNFMSSALVSGQTRRTGVSTVTLTITQVKMTLHLAITIWVPDGVTQKVLEHEEGHRRISEFFYQDADKLAARVAATYIGRQLTVTGNDLNTEANKALQQIGDEITAEYTRQLDPGPAQLRYDDITDHARNEVLVQDAVAEVTIR